MVINVLLGAPGSDFVRLIEAIVNDVHHYYAFFL